MIPPRLSHPFSPARLAWLLAPAAGLYGAAVWLRGKLFDWGVLPSRVFPVPIVCIGNLSAGGTGKTPHVEYVLRLLHSCGYRVAVLSRGYRRKTRGFLLMAQGVTAREVGDEPCQMGRNCPFATVAVCEDRVRGVERLLALPAPPQVIVMDDGYQHRRVKAGLYVLLTDAARPYTRDRLLPWGRLREPAGAARRAAAVVVTKCRAGERPPLPVAAGQRLFYSRIAYGEPQPFPAPQGADAPERAESGGRRETDAAYKGRRVLLFTGIARPSPLRRHIAERGGTVVGELAFPDHHDFTPGDLRRIEAAFKEARADMAVTTQKDAARLSPGAMEAAAPQTWRSLHVQPIAVEVESGDGNEKTFNQTLLDYVEKNKRDGGLD